MQNIKSLKLVCFSPTGTTKTILQGIGRGTGINNVELIDITKPKARQQILKTGENDLLIVGVPVYMGRVPELINDWLNGIQAQNTPTVCVVVYGNREYDDALLELKNILAEQGCIPIAGGAFIGEHSFSHTELPIADGRPDKSDLDQAELFGQKIVEKLASISTNDSMTELKVPGNYPYGGATEVWSAEFIQVSDACNLCGICAEICPTGAIDLNNGHSIDIVKCISCCACIKSCPEHAKSIMPGEGRVINAARKLNKNCSEPKEPVFFI